MAMLADKIFETRSGLYISHHKNHREGPKFYYVVRKGRTCRMFADVDQLLKWIKWPKNLPTGAALREWIEWWDKRDNKVPADSEVSADQKHCDTSLDLGS